MNKLEIVALSQAEVPAMAKLYQATFSDSNWNVSRLRSCFSASYRVFGLKDVKQLIGFVILHLMVDEAELICIAVDPTQQNKGFGKGLLVHVWKILQSLAIQRLLLEVRVSNTAAKCFYKNNGFKVVGRRKRYYQCDDGSREDALVMSRQLALG